MAVPVIVISPKGALAPGESYYSFASEYPNNPILASLLRFVVYTWAYVQPPATLTFPNNQPPQ